VSCFTKRGVRIASGAKTAHHAFVRKGYVCLAAFGAFISLPYCLLASEAEALAIDAAILARHMPFGTILNPIYASSTSSNIVGYTRCGDSALWTGAYLAAESFRYSTTQSPDALNNVKTALSGIESLVDVTGDNRLARCIVPANSPYAAGIESEEAANTIHQAPPYIWVDNTSRDEVIGVFFGLGAAYDLVDDAGVKSRITSVTTLLSGFISGHQWSPNDDISNTFLVRPEELQMLVQVTRHVNPSSTLNAPFYTPPVSLGVTVDVLGLSSYFKFNLDYMTFYNLIRLQDNSDNRSAYETIRNYTAAHQNAFFDLIDCALTGPNGPRDAETTALMDEWLQRSRRDFTVDVSKTVAVCTEACAPVPVSIRPPGDFLWQVDPFQLSGGGSGVIETAGIDYILPYWMARYYGVIQADADAQSSAAPVDSMAPNALASLYGSNLAAAVASAQSQPPATALGGVTVTVTDSAGVARNAPLLYVSPGQINFEIPDGAAPGVATIKLAGSGAGQIYEGAIQAVAPALFTMNGAGTGVAAATAISVPANSQTQNPVQVFQCGTTGCIATPIVLASDATVYLTLYGSAIRNLSSLANVALAVNGVSLPVLYAGPAPGFAGLDQVNVSLPLNLRGSGASNVTLTVDGQTSNVVTMNIQ
jgi:uncharacterized protein (TIGR03437 family)